MQYYLLMPGDREETLSEANLLGESSFDNFWAGSGLRVLMTLVDKQPEVLEAVRIISDTNKRFSIAEFLEEIANYKIIYK
jgi:hypothetical protein